MSGWYEQARVRLEQEYGQGKGQKETAMKGAVRDALLEFCRQSWRSAAAARKGYGRRCPGKSVGSNMSSSWMG